MHEFKKILDSYANLNIEKEISSFEGLISFSTKFYKDVAEIYDSVTRIRNVKRNPSGFNFNDAAILGLLIRIWKILKEVIRYYEENNAQIISMLDRPIIEAAIISKRKKVPGHFSAHRTLFCSTCEP
ncbi:MAG TPA: hypothetical protein VI861_02835 [Rickettsiales bacterium]|nr:hypothetical protein [Rickettsiales bacterium]